MARSGTPWIEIDDEMISGFTGCNRFGLRHAEPEPALRGHVGDVGQIEQTLAGCPEDVVVPEDRFLAALRAGTRFVHAGKALEVRDARDVATLRFAPWAKPLQVPALDGTRWCLQDMGGRALAASNTVTLEFKPGGFYRGHAGCRNFAGTYADRNGTLSSTSLAMDPSECPDPEALQLEGEYIAALSDVVQVERDGQRIVWTTMRGVELVFNACRFPR